MSLYGYGRETTPNLDRFASRCTVYHSHYAAGNFTSPGTASILTGVYPWSHRAFHLYGKVRDEYAQKNLFSLFDTAGYHTLAYTHNSLTQVQLYQMQSGLDLLKEIGDLALGKHIAEQAFAPDFEVAIQSEWLLFRELAKSEAPSSLFYSLLNRAGRKKVNIGRLAREEKTLFPRGPQTNFGPVGGISFILEHAIDWLETELGRFPQPFLGYVHLYPPHEPYNPRYEFIGIFDDGWQPPAKPAHYFTMGMPNDYLNWQRRQYDEHLAYADAEFGRVYDTLARERLLENSYVILTSDHGQLFERGIHGHITETLYEPLIHIPLLISAPGQAYREDVRVPTSCIDLLPTLLHAAHHTIPDWCEGQVLPPFEHPGPSHDEGIFAVEAKRNPRHAPLTTGTVAVIKDQFKLIHYLGYDGYHDEYELYDLANDPEEMNDLYHPNRAMATDLRHLLQTRLGQANGTK